MATNSSCDLVDELIRCRHWIQAALDEGGNTHEFSDIVSAVLQGRMQFWPAADACAVTEIIEFPRKKYLHIFLAGGNKKTIIDMNESAAFFAKECGCDGISIAGRRGWVRELKNHGWRETFTSLAREV